jgi:hypothetical protein
MCCRQVLTVEFSMLVAVSALTQYARSEEKKPHVYTAFQLCVHQVATTAAHSLEQVFSEMSTTVEQAYQTAAPPKLVSSLALLAPTCSCSNGMRMLACWAQPCNYTPPTMGTTNNRCPMLLTACWQSAGQHPAEWGLSVASMCTCSPAWSVCCCSPFAAGDTHGTPLLEEGPPWPCAASTSASAAGPLCRLTRVSNTLIQHNITCAT